MSQSFISNMILLIILSLSLLSRNNALSIATCVLLLVSLVGQIGEGFREATDFILRSFDSYGLTVGIIILMIGIMAPIAKGEVELNDMYQMVKSVEGIIALISGIIVSVLAAKGGFLLLEKNIIMLSLVFGTIIGVVAFKGYPIGPLVGSGITAIVLSIIKAIKNTFT